MHGPLSDLPPMWKAFALVLGFYVGFNWRAIADWIADRLRKR
jgi:hypothetical protein